ncbi:MaoC/PaaZ C-terminal domain-containing protein [Thalassolituus sp. LLYu03]|uniref:MaoC family dehydratase n=1 Tax=Thalassolituus sp. LLYu03 TaxID=3421656 RepID=UPI003D282BA0
MSQAVSMQFSSAPGTIGQYLRALTARGTGQSKPEFPTLDALLVGVLADSAKVKAYARVCGFNDNSGYLPLTYPHILAFPLHMELMLHKSFPLPLMGLVHISNRITQRRRIRVSDKLDIHCRLGESRQTDKGTEFDILTTVSSAGEELWSSVSTNLFRRASGAAAKGPRTPQAPAQFDSSEYWTLPSSLGRQYARVSGDSNPIHLHPLAAKLFGFKRHIAHGMWSKARIAAALAEKFSDGAVEFACDFKLPVFLPAKLELCYSRSEDGQIRFELRNPGGDKVHVKGTIGAPKA